MRRQRLITKLEAMIQYCEECIEYYKIVFSEELRRHDVKIIQTLLKNQILLKKLKYMRSKL